MKNYIFPCVPGFKEWAQSTGIVFENTGDQVPIHLLQPGDCVYGCVDIPTAAKIHEKGSRVFILEFSIPQYRRELGTPIDWKLELASFSPRLVEYSVVKK